MARIRTIKPQHCADKELVTISLQAHLLWVLNWCFSDDKGVFENDPYLIKSNVFPRRQDVRIEQINQWLGQLEKARYIIPFTHDGVGYYINRTFHIHQKIDRPQPSKIPDDVIQRVLDEHSSNVRPCIGEDGKVKVGEGKASPPLEPKKNQFIPSEKQELAFKNFCVWMESETPEVCKLPKKITIIEYIKLRGEYPDGNGGNVPGVSKEQVMQTLRSIENNKDYLKKYRSPYLCVLNWNKRKNN